MIDWKPISSASFREYYDLLDRLTREIASLFIPDSTACTADSRKESTTYSTR